MLVLLIIKTNYKVDGLGEALWVPYQLLTLTGWQIEIGNNLEILWLTRSVPDQNEILY